MELSDLIGAIGVTLILIAFLLNLMRRMPASSLSYLLLNAVGAGLACLSSLLIGFWPFVVLEAVWCLAAILSLAGLRPFATSGR